MIAEQSIKQLIEFRKHLHAHPELSGQEVGTAQTVKEKLEGFAPDLLITIGGTGLAAVFEGKEAGPSVLLRSELDALPIQEINEFSHRSQQEQVAHKCGHDGHSTILIGVAEQLSRERPASGRVILLFQPAEETGEGAKAVLNDPNFEQITPDYAIAMHNLPGIPNRVVVLKPGTFTSAVTTLIFKLHGKTAHAAEPENGINPIYAINEIVNRARKLEQPDQNKKDFTLITPVYSKVGSLAYGTAPGEGELHLTVRSWDKQKLQDTSKLLADWATTYALSNGIKLDISTEQDFAPNINDPFVVGLIEDAARSHSMVIGQTALPFRWGEDFGLFTERFRGAMFGMGAGDDWPALHNPDYDFPDEIISPSVTLFLSIIKKLNG